MGLAITTYFGNILILIQIVFWRLFNNAQKAKPQKMLITATFCGSQINIKLGNKYFHPIL